MRMCRKLAGGWFAICVLLAAAFGGAYAAPAADEGLTPVPPLVSRVTDLTGTITAAQKSALEQELADFERRKGSQIVVLIVGSTKPEAIEQYSIRVAEQWKPGRKGVDDGLLLLVAKNDQRIRIEVGRGLEGPIPDVIAKRVIKEVIAPHFVAGDFFGGIEDGVQRLIGLIDGEKLPPPKQRGKPQQDGGDWQSMLSAGFIFIVVAGAMLTKMFGRVAGSGIVGLIAGAIAWVVIGGLLAVVFVAVIGFIAALVMGSGGGWGHGGGIGYGGGGGWGGSGGSAGGFSGGGGDFGGGGASGSWGD
jgi:uncharacterized protein